MTIRIALILALIGMILPGLGCVSWQQPDNHNVPPYCFADRDGIYCHETMQDCQWERDLAFQGVPETEVYERGMTECAPGRTRVHVGAR